MSSEAEAGTRERLLYLLKLHGPLSAGELARRLRVTPMAVRQHLARLERGGEVAFEEERRPVGRPTRMWRVTERASGRFPASYADLALGLIGATREAFGNDGLERMIDARRRQQARTYAERLPAGRASLASRVAALARLRTEEGYMAEWSRARDGSFTLTENHCPVGVAARACPGLCRGELELFRDVLGPRVRVERTEHQLEGDRRCVYRILAD